MDDEQKPEETPAEGAPAATAPAEGAAAAAEGTSAAAESEVPSQPPTVEAVVLQSKKEEPEEAKELKKVNEVLTEMENVNQQRTAMEEHKRQELLAEQADDPTVVQKIQSFEKYVDKRRKADDEIIKKYKNAKGQLEIAVERKTSARTLQLIEEKKEDQLAQLDWRSNLLKAVTHMENSPPAREMTDEQILNEGYSFYAQQGTTFHGYIFKAMKKDSDKDMVAKVIDLSKVEASYEKNFRQQSMKVMSFLKLFQFRSLVDIYDVLLVDKTKLIILEENLKIDLERWLANEQKLTQKTIKVTTDGLAKALYFLHNIGVVHQNVNHQNIYFNPNGILKLSAMEYSKICWSLQTNSVQMQRYPKQIVAGRYIAPEISNGSIYDPTKIDVYSFGIMLCYMVLKRYPYDSQRPEDLRQQWTTSFYEMRLVLGSLPLDLVSRCVNSDPEKRIDIREAVEHPFFTSSL